MCITVFMFTADSSLYIFSKIKILSLTARCDFVIVFEFFTLNFFDKNTHLKLLVLDLNRKHILAY